MKSLFLGILLIIILGFGGFVYRNAVEHPLQPIVCPLDAMVCPDGTSVGRTGSSCTFPACPPPNVSLPDISIAFAAPMDFTPGESSDAATIATYEKSIASSTIARIIIRRYPITASSTALATIQQTAIGQASRLPVSATSFTSTVLGNHRFTVVSLGRFEGVIDTAYYLARNTDVLRFDAIDMGVSDWTDPSLDISKLPTRVALEKLLTTLQGQ